MIDHHILELIARVSQSYPDLPKLCFACGGPPSTGKGEHVIPLWLQNRLNLGTERLTLLNGTKIQYKNLTIPCCEDCNTGFLSQIENSASQIFDNPNFETKECRLHLGRWMAKILFGILIKETTLPYRRDNISLGTIIPTDLLEDFTHAQLLFQSHRKATAFDCLHGDFPFTIFCYHIKEDEKFGNFDLSTNIAGQSIALRINNVGIIFINDGGLQLEAGSKGPYGLDGSTLHPIQFSEICSRVHYKSSLCDASHQYLSSENPESIYIRQLFVRHRTPGLLPDGSRQIFRTWNESEFLTFRNRYENIAFDENHGQNEHVSLTCLVDEIGKQINPDLFNSKKFKS